MVRLHLGKVLSAVKNQKHRQQAARLVYSMLQPVGQQLREDIAGFASAIQCSQDLTAANAEIRLIVSRTSEAISRAVAAVQQPFKLGNYQVPATMQVIHQPPGTVQILMCHPPPGLAKQGLTYGVLAAAGYKQDVEVMAEFVGGDSQLGAAATALPCLNTVVAWVKPPPGDRYLRKLPDAFEHSFGCTQLFVQGRKAGAWDLWQQDDDELQCALRYVRNRLQHCIR